MHLSRQPILPKFVKILKIRAIFVAGLLQSRFDCLSWQSHDRKSYAGCVILHGSK